MKQLVELLQKVMVFVTPDLKQIISENVEAGKDWTRDKAEEVLDKLEDAAAKTATPIDDAAVKMVREVLNLPDLPDEPAKAEAESAEATKTE